jgi:hypothetical protein
MWIDKTDDAKRRNKRPGIHYDLLKYIKSCNTWWKLLVRNRLASNNADKAEATFDIKFTPRSD